MTGRAIVLEVKNGSCTVVTADGEFRKLKIRGDYRPGQEITLPEARRRVNRLALLAASLTLFLAATALWRVMMPPAIAAYVTLELDSAVELAVDGDNVVRGVRLLEGGGQDLAAGLDLTGMPLDQAVEKIVTEAVGKNIITEDNSVVLSTVTPVKDPDPSGLDSLVRKTVESSLKSRGIDGRVLMGRASPEIREKAGSQGFPTGRYMLYLDAAKTGEPVDPEDFKKKKITSIEKDRKIKVRENLRVETGDQREPDRDEEKQRVQSDRGGPQVLHERPDRQGDFEKDRAWKPGEEEKRREEDSRKDRDKKENDWKRGRENGLKSTVAAWGRDRINAVRDELLRFPGRKKGNHDEN
ncbi:MAG: anti-sigma factor domain-containing protein [Peptococcaceae bacterium]|nr:anti-sigma factor domain-containing protein [Peptococcaceae bacterium]